MLLLFLNISPMALCSLPPFFFLASLAIACGNYMGQACGTEYVLLYINMCLFVSYNKDKL